jgi:hypothetical protein
VGPGASRAAWRPLAIGLVLLAVAIRLYNDFVYPADRGFDASFNWRYIYRLFQDRALPDPAAGWSTGDPPLYFALGALLMSGLDALGAFDFSVLAIPLFSTLCGLAIAWLAAGDEPRAWLGALLVLYLPAHVHMSVMVNEEILAALLVSVSVALLAAGRAEGAAPERTRDLALVGVAGGLALLAKLSGATALATAGLTRAIEGWRARAPLPALRALAVLALAGFAAGGWYYARNRLEFGYFQPFGLPAHQVMFRMPPGERFLGDYLRVPLATWTDPQLLHPDLLRSVWGSTFASAWFDGHRFFLPAGDAGVRLLGSLTLVLALLPTAAFGLGLARGARRALSRPRSPDLPLSLLVALALAGYVLFTWQNPWFVVVKGTSLLGLALPYAVYASDPLARWLRRGGAVGAATALALAALVACVVAGTSFGLLFERPAQSGLPWEAAAPAPAPDLAPGD